MATKRPPGLIYDDADIDAVVRTMLGEAAGEGDDGLAAVAHVLVNRLEKGGYGKSLYSVAHAPKQFSAWNSSGNGGNDLVNVSEDDPRYVKARSLAEEVLNGRHDDPTGGATNYYAPKGMTGKNGTSKGEPSWASKMSYTGSVGGHRFYSDDSAAGAAEQLATGSDVAGLQQKLADKGFSPGAIDGIAGPKTKAAIREFQQANGLTVDGIVGPRTLAALETAAKSNVPDGAMYGVRTGGGDHPGELPTADFAGGDLTDDFQSLGSGTYGRSLSSLLSPKTSAQPSGGTSRGRTLGSSLPTNPPPSDVPTLGSTMAEQNAGRTLGFKPLPFPGPLVAPVSPETIGNAAGLSGLAARGGYWEHTPSPASAGMGTEEVMIRRTPTLTQAGIVEGDPTSHDPMIQGFTTHADGLGAIAPVAPVMDPGFNFVPFGGSGESLAPMGGTPQSPVTPVQPSAVPAAPAATPAPKLLRLPSGKMIAPGSYTNHSSGITSIVTEGPNGEAIVTPQRKGFVDIGSEMNAPTILGGFIRSKMPEAINQAGHGLESAASNFAPTVQNAATDAINNVAGSPAAQSLGNVLGGIIPGGQGISTLGNLGGNILGFFKGSGAPTTDTQNSGMMGRNPPGGMFAPHVAPSVTPRTNNAPANENTASAPQTFQGSSTGRTYEVGKIYQGSNGPVVATADGKFKKVS